MSYVYRKSEPELWTVGHYDPQGTFRPDTDHSSKEGAARRVHYLNGGGATVEEIDERIRRALEAERYTERIEA